METRDTPTAPRPGLAAAAAGLLATALLAACSAGPGHVALPDPGPGACGPEERARGAPAGSLTVVADGPARPLRLPRAGSPAERLLVRHLHRSLVRVDCRGRVRTDLAESWRREEDGRRWRFRLSPQGRPGGGTITAADVVASWREARLADDAAPPSLLDSLEIRTPDPRTLVAEAPRPLPSPAVFARPVFAVAGPPTSGGWPGATGPYRPARPSRSPPGGPADGLLTLRPVAGGSGPVLRIAPAGPDRARDLVDAGADLVLTRDPGVLAYAGSLDGMAVRPLPWDRTYLLLVPPGAAGPATETPAGSGSAAELSRSLARHAVRGDARAAPGEGWWSGGGCGTAADGAGGGPGDGEPAPPSPAGPGRGSLVRPAGDRAAGALAGRLVALAGRGDGPLPWEPTAAPVRAAAAEGEAFRRSLRSGGAAGYVVPVPHRVLDPCGARAALRARAPWLDRPGARAVPLVTTRPGLAVRRGLAGLRIDWDGVPRLERVVRRTVP